MKKKLIIAAAIAFAVFAIPCGSNALSTVSVASENNTVPAASGNNTVTPTPAPEPTVTPQPDQKTITETKNAIVAIDISEITDDLSAVSARDAVVNAGVENLKYAMNTDVLILNKVEAIENAIAKQFGVNASPINNKDNVGVEAVDVVGVILNDSTATLNIAAPSKTPAIPASATDPVYVEIYLEGSYLPEKLAVPVAVTVKVPAGIDGNKAVIYHFNADGTVKEAIKPIYNDGKLTFAVSSFSTFAIAEAKDVNSENDGFGAFAQYRADMENVIANAKDGATVTITRDKNINALPNDIMKALYKKQTVSLVLEYTYEGKEYSVTIPAGKAEDNAIEWYGPLYLQMRYGK